MAKVRYDNYQSDKEKADYAKKHPSTKVPPRPPRWVMGRISPGPDGDIIDMTTTHLHPGDELDEKGQCEQASLDSLGLASLK